MKNIAIYKNKRSGQLKSVVLQSPCFRVFTVARESRILSERFLEENDLMYLGYVAEESSFQNQTLKEVWSDLFNNNPLFSGCSVVGTHELHGHLSSLSCSMTDETCYGESGYSSLSVEELISPRQSSNKIVFLQEIVNAKYPKGIPTHQFIVANFTARNVANMNSTYATPFRNLISKLKAKGKHPFLAYLINKTIDVAFPCYNNPSNELVVRTVDSRENDNISRESFGTMAYNRIANFLTYGGNNPLDKGDYLLSQRGYQRDTELSEMHIEANEVSGYKRLTMSDSLSIPGDSAFIYQQYATGRYFSEFIKTLSGEATQPNVTLGIGDIVYLKTTHFCFNNLSTDRRPHRPLASLSGLIVSRDQIIGFDPTRVESIQLKISGWVMPSSISLEPDPRLPENEPMFKIYMNNNGEYLIPSCKNYGGGMTFYNISAIRNLRATRRNTRNPTQKAKSAYEFLMSDSSSYRFNTNTTGLTTVMVEDMVW